MKLLSPFKKISTSSTLPFSVAFHDPIHSASYQDLNRFREELDASGHSFKTGAFHHHKKSAFMYRCIFFGISALFFILLTIMCFQKTSWFCIAYFNQHYIAKLFACILCGSLGIASLSMGLSIRAEKEAVQHLFRMFRSKIFRMYMRKRALLGWKQIVAFLHHEPDSISKEYDQSIEKLQEKRESTLTLLGHIRKSTALDKVGREKLFNQALSELKDHMNKIALNFQG